MKHNFKQGSLILICVVLFTSACKKSVDSVNMNPAINNTQHDTSLAAQTQAIPYPTSLLAECNNAPDYGDSIIYSQPVAGNDFFVYPQNNHGVDGTYLSWPVGLSLDAASGAINLTQSETGQRYAVAFVKSGTTDTCMSQLIIGGASYMDSVYVLTKSDTTARPYFNANPNVASPCQGSQGQGSGCKFDYNNTAQNQGIEIDQNTGYIDLVKTMKNNPFGQHPVNGASVNTTVYYKLNDNSNYAGQKIQLKMVYYNHKSDIPNATMVTITDNLFNTLNNLLISKGPSARPPLIIIVRSN